MIRDPQETTGSRSDYQEIPDPDPTLKKQPESDLIKLAQQKTQCNDINILL